MKSFSEKPKMAALKSPDASGIACDRSSGFPRLCLVADDETQGAQIVILKDEKLVAGDFIKLTNAQHDGKPLESTRKASRSMAARSTL